jgi:DNA invertase Pin-like site-specific DNA recombinase
MAGTRHCANHLVAATIVDRISAGIERRAKQGRWFGGRPPFGYLFSSEERVLTNP